MKILHLIDSFDFNGSAQQLRTLAPALMNDETTLEVCCLGPETPWLGALRQAGVVVHALDWTRWFDPSVLWNLRAVLRETAADLIHAWRLPALRALAVVAPDLLPRVVMSGALPAKGNFAWWDRRLLRRVCCLAVAGVGDQERCGRAGLIEPMPRIVPPGKRCQDPFLEEKGPDTFLRVVCVGRLERAQGFRNALWAFDFLRYVFPDARLQIVGGGSQRTALEELAVGLQMGGDLQFLGPLDDAAAVLKDADIVWIPSLANCGRQVALEAMALGRAVIASAVPCLGELVADGVTGFLVPPGDVVQLARRTRTLFLDEALRRRLGEAAQQQVRSQFPLEQAVAQWRDLYRSVAA